MGMFQLPKTSAAMLAVGARVAWNNTAKEVATPVAGRLPIGVAVEAAGNGVASVAVRLDTRCRSTGSRTERGTRLTS